MADAKFEPKLPKTFAKSLQLKPHEPSVLVKARTHEKKAEALRQDAKDAVREAHREAQKNPRQPAPEPDAPRPHLEYLERFKALEITVAPIEARAKHEWANKLGEEPKPHQVIGHVIASLPRPRMDALFRDPRLAELNVAIHHRKIQKIVTENELLQDLGITWMVFLDAKRDLRFQLGLQSYKSALAIACYLTVVRAACEPKVRKTHNLVDDQEVLGLASGILREVTTHIIEEMQAAQDSFFAVGDRRAVGEQFRIDRAQKSGRAAPPADAPKGKPLPPTATTKARPKEANAASPPIKPKPGAMKA